MLGSPPLNALFPEAAAQSLREMVQNAPDMNHSGHGVDKVLSPGAKSTPFHATDNKQRDALERTGAAAVICGAEVAAAAVVRAAKGLFKELDADGNGLIDKDELGDLVNTLCDRIGQARPNPASVQQQVNNCLAVYDTDGDGSIDIDEFVKMLNNRPWKALLPADVSAALDRSAGPRVVAPRPRVLKAPSTPSEAMAAAAGYLDTAQEHREATVQTILGSEVAARAVAKAATGLFKQADADNNGRIDVQELTALVEQMRLDMGLSEGGGVHNRGKRSAADEAAKAIAEFSKNGADLTFDQFLDMLCSDGWRSLLPVGANSTAVAELLPKVLKKPIQENARMTAAKEAAGKAAVRAARQLFQDADADGNGLLDPDELAWLVQALATRMAGETVVLGEDELHAQVSDAFARFDTDHDGVISFSEFLEMMKSKPWSALLPGSIQGHIEPFSQKEVARHAQLEAAAEMVGKAKAAQEMPPLRPSEAIRLAAIRDHGAESSNNVAVDRHQSASGAAGVVQEPQVIRARLLATGHTQDFRYAVQENSIALRKLAESQSRAPPSFRKHRVTLPTSFSYAR